MKALYRDLGHTVGKYRAVSIDKDEARLQGSRGFITKMSAGRLLAAVITRGRNEKIYRFDIKDLEKWILRIGHFKSLRDQLVYANNMGRDLDL